MQDEQNCNGYYCRHCDKPLLGQRRKWCNTQCQKAGINPKKPTCQCCGNKLPSRKRMWCSDQCNPNKLRKHGTQDDYQAALRANSNNIFFCAYCGKENIKKLPGTNKTKGYKNKFCNMLCRVSIQEAVRQEIASLKRIREANKPKSIPKALLEKVRLCPCCKIEVLEPKRRKCDSCKAISKDGESAKAKRKAYKKEYKKAYKLTEKAKASKRAHRMKRRTLERGAKVGEAFDPFDVFDRDGWRCQMCGVDTPKRLRGTIKPTAPELDHITPLGRGGKHTMTNAQCACRTCNITKGAGTRIYQAGLFTGLGIEPANT